jgi:hypothetical protein
VVILWNELGNDYSVIYKSSIILTISNKSHRDSGLVQQTSLRFGRGGFEDVGSKKKS